MKVYQYLIVLILLAGSVLTAQEQLVYQTPPESILELVNAPLTPRVQVDSKGENVLLLYRDTYKSIATLSEKELRLAGLRINPKTNISSRKTYYNDIKLKKALDENLRTVAGLPQNSRLSNFSWSPSQAYVAFTNTTETGVEVWLLNISSASVTRLITARANANLGKPMTWFKDSGALLVKIMPESGESLVDTELSVPTGPVITESTGEKAQNRTYQDLLKNRDDEHNFQVLVTSKIVKVTLNGQESPWLNQGMYRSISFSPNGEYVKISEIQRPFSYIVTYSRFPFKTNIYHNNGSFVKTVMDVPLMEVLPKGFMAVRTGKRQMTWRLDRPSTLVWCEALDGGDPDVEVPYRDEIFQQEISSKKQGVSLIKLVNRYSNIEWGSRKIAIAHDYWWNTRNIKTYLFDPSKSKQKGTIISDRNYQDRYSDPGYFVHEKNKYHESVLAIHKKSLFLIGAGFSAEGQYPFIDKFSLRKKTSSRIYRSTYEDKIEDIYEAIDFKKGQYLVRLESKNEYPNYYLRDIHKKGSLTAITHFDNPFKSLQDIHKEVITYFRDDGLELNATLYLPLNHDVESGEKAPMILWAYPREYKDKNSASQKTSNPNRFVYPYYGSPIYWVTRGYVVLDRAAFPIIGEGDQEPNDSFRSQLVANASAAIDAVNKLGYIDPDRVAVGGHSYGAFMVANLLSHSNLFAAGIARSGAYNRTLTPFGFQSEERSYWEAPEVYYRMSPFMHADKMKTPLLLIHGEADNNSGTYPLQSERYFNALKGLGAPARLVMLPKESHGYRAKESILHLLWEQDRWLDKYVMNKGK
ncbi:MAG: prolyl oligopeptidase family serine peptidase [Candidatus Marinimicrobia bacterium]|nr:prolyl oligopeptidase family serine peptidase [Candidatus Neomarinimicrobiota bacterium]